MTIELTEEQRQSLIFALGFAAGVAMRDQNTPLARSIFRLTNAVQADNSNWEMLEVE